jgi:hypothetical protein
MHLVFHHSVAKQLHEPELNEDYYRPTRHVPNGPLVVSDGASESYDARTWSRLLVSRYRKRPRFDAAWIAQATARYAAYRTSSTLSWSKQAAFERGSFATLLALHLARDFSRADILAVGDSLAVFGIDGVICNSFPYTSPDRFSERPLLISTLSDRNCGLLQDMDRFWTSWTLSTDSTLMAMTDALGAWLLTEPTSRFPILASMRSRRDFAELIETERIARRLRRDDATLLVLQ